MTHRSTALSKADIRALFEALNAELAAESVRGEVYVVGGAVMCIALNARASTRDVDAVFEPAAVVRAASRRVAAKSNVPDNWLNDAAKAFIGTRGAFDEWLELSHLKIFVAQPEYILAMKCTAMRLGVEFHDLDDVRFLLRYLNITSAREALAVVGRYFDDSALPPKTRFALEELLGE